MGEVEEETEKREGDTYVFCGGSGEGSMTGHEGFGPSGDRTLQLYKSVTQNATRT